MSLNPNLALDSSKRRPFNNIVILSLFSNENIKMLPTMAQTHTLAQISLKIYPKNINKLRKST